jgi:glucosamine-phosphate N-acetyltransferase
MKLFSTPPSHLEHATALLGWVAQVILDCADANVGFYEKCGLERKGVEMAKYF